MEEAPGLMAKWSCSSCGTVNAGGRERCMVCSDPPVAPDAPAVSDTPSVPVGQGTRSWSRSGLLIGGGILLTVLTAAAVMVGVGLATADDEKSGSPAPATPSAPPTGSPSPSRPAGLGRGSGSGGRS